MSAKPKAESLQEALDEYARACQWEGYLIAAHDDERGRDARREMLGARSDLETFVLDALAWAIGWGRDERHRARMYEPYVEDVDAARAIIERREV